MNKLLVFLLTLFLFSCNQHQTVAVLKGEIEPWFLADSLYKFHDYHGILCDTDRPNLVQMDSTAEKILLSKTPDFSPDYCFMRRAFYFSKQNKTGGLQPIIIYVTGDDYNSFIMIFLNEKNEIVSCKEIQGGDYGGPDNYSDRMELESNFCNIRDEKNIGYFRIKDIYPVIDSDHVTQNPTMHDSISYLIMIDNAGKFQTSYLDSLRVKNH